MSCCSKSFYLDEYNLNHLVIRMMHPKSKLKITDRHTHIHTLTRARGNSKLVPLCCCVVSCIQLLKPTMIKLTTSSIIQIFQGILIPFSLLPYILVFINVSKWNLGETHSFQDYSTDVRRIFLISVHQKH